MGASWARPVRAGTARGAMAAWLREGRWALLEIKQGGPLTHGLPRSPDRGMDAPYVVVTMERRSPASRGCLRLIGRRPRPSHGPVALDLILRGVAAGSLSGTITPCGEIAGVAFAPDRKEAIRASIQQKLGAR